MWHKRNVFFKQLRTPQQWASEDRNMYEFEY